MNRPQLLALAAGSLVAGAGIAGEVAAQTIAAASGGHVPADPVVGNLFNPLDGLSWLGMLNGKCEIAPWIADWMSKHASCKTPLSFVQDADMQVAPWLAGGAASMAGCLIASGRPKKSKVAKGKVFPPVHQIEGRWPKVAIKLGTATGALSDRGCASGIRAGEIVTIVDEHLSLDFLITGGKGGGKSTLALNQIALQAIEQGCGAVFFNVKGDVHHTVRELARRAGREKDLRIIGVDALHFDLLAGLNPSMASTFLGCMLFLTGVNETNASFWNGTATNYARGILGLLETFPEYYSLGSLSRYIFEDEFRIKIDRMVAVVEREYEAGRSRPGTDVAGIDRALLQIKESYGEIAKFYKKTHEIQVGARSQLELILSNMTSQAIDAAFGTMHKQGEEMLTLEALYEKRAIYVVNAPLQEYGFAAAAAMGFFKLRVFAVMQQRRMRFAAAKEILRNKKSTKAERELAEAILWQRVGIFIDEFQEIVACSTSGTMSDEAFLATSRDTLAFTVCATQSIDSLYGKINHVHLANALLANLRQKIYLRGEDPDTIEKLLKLLGDVEVDQQSESVQQPKPFSWFRTRSTSTSLMRRPVADASIVRNLHAKEALMLLTAGEGESYDDVVKMESVYA